MENEITMLSYLSGKKKIVSQFFSGSTLESVSTATVHGQSTMRWHAVSCLMGS